LAQACQHLRLAAHHDVYQEFTSVHRTIHPAPSPPDAGRDTVPSRFRCQSGDCGYRVRGLCTGRYLHWVGTERVASRYVSPCPPLDPYVRLSPHTAHESGILWDGSISPAPRCILHGQLYAFAGYLCTISRPAPSGPSPCARFSRTRTTMPYLTACRASEFSLGSPLPTLHSPSHPCQALPCSLWRTLSRCCRWRVTRCPIRSLRLLSRPGG